MSVKRALQALNRNISLSVTLLLDVVWLLLWTSTNWEFIFSGLLLAILIQVIFPMPKIKLVGHLRPVRLLILLVVFLKDLALAGGHVAWTVLRNKPVRCAVIRVELHSRSDFYLGMVSNLTSLIPGSVVVQNLPATGTLYLHIFDIDWMGGEDMARQSVLEQEKRLMQALASNQDLKDAGYSRSSKLSASTPRTEEV